MCVFAITKESLLVAAEVECKIHSWDMFFTGVKMYISKEAFTEENRFSLQYKPHGL